MSLKLAPFSSVLLSGAIAMMFFIAADAGVEILTSGPAEPLPLRLQLLLTPAVLSATAC